MNTIKIEIASNKSNSYTRIPVHVKDLASVIRKKKKYG